MQKSKSVLRLLHFYKVHFQFHQPYTLILDGNSLAKFLKIGIDYQKAFKRIFNALTFIKLTSCLLFQFENLPTQFRHLKEQAKKLQTISCGHLKGVTPRDCLADLAGRNNEKKYSFCTQDEQLIQKLLQVPNAPIFYIGPDNLIRMREPLRQTKQLAEVIENNRSGPRLEQQLKFEQDKSKEELSRRQQMVSKIIRERKRLGIKIKKKAKGPNPLSCKKRERPLALKKLQSKGRGKRVRSKKTSMKGQT